MRSRAGILVVLCVLVVLGFYARAAVSYGKPLAPNGAPQYGSFQNPIADALLSHQLSLKVKPEEGLLRLPNPYDPIANDPYRAQGIHDFSLYKGKFYSYFGPAPAILLYIPFRIFQVGDLSPTIGTLIFAAVGFMFSLLSFRILVRWCVGEIPLWMQCIAIFTLGLGVPVMWIVYIGRDYEASIACAYMLLFIGLYCLARGSLTRPNPVFLALGSLALGLAIAARPSAAAGIVFVIAAAAMVVGKGARIGSGRRNSCLAALIVPYLVMIVLVALFNYARFGSISEFGQSYQLSLVDVRTYPFESFSYIPKGLYAYLLSPVRVLGDFPYLFLRKQEFDPVLIAQGPGLHKYLSEPVAGILTNMPVVGAGFVLLVTRFRATARRLPRVYPTIVVLLLPAAALLLAVSYQFQGATMRYELDFAPLIVFASLLGWIAWYRSARGRSWVTWLGNGLWIAALAASIIFNLAITTTPCTGTGSC